MNNPGWVRGAAGLLLVGALLLAGALLPPDRGASAVEVGPLDLELDGPGDNVDDPCFWTSTGSGAQRTLLFVTAKDSGLVEVFELPGGTFVGAIGGFGRPNHCAVAGDLLLTTDRGAGQSGALPGKVKVHHVPDLEPVRTFGEDLVEPHGIDVASVDGATRVYVTDSSDATVHVYDLVSGTRVDMFSTGFGAGIEPILVDVRHGRLFVPRGEKEKVRGVGVFDMQGKLVREFGGDVVHKDAEGLAIYACDDGGYLIVTDQDKKKTQFEVFERRELRHLGTFTLHDGRGDYSSATDGIDILQTPVQGFPAGILAVCDGCGTNRPDEMDVVSWVRVARALGLKECPAGLGPPKASSGASGRSASWQEATSSI